MKNLRDRSKISAIAFVLLLSFSAMFIALPIVSAHDPQWTISTYAFLSVQPNPVGVGQTAYIGMWIDKVPPAAIGRAWGPRWHNYEVTVTKPNGDTETLGPFNSDAVGGAWTAFVPDQIGEYEFVFTFPGQVPVNENPYPYDPGALALTYAFLGDNYLGSTSDVVTLTVQQDQIETAYPPNPFPEEYWERPIHSMNRNWYSLGGNWLGLGSTSFGVSGLYNTSGNFNPYTTAPNSGHVMWTKPIAFGGQIGGEHGDSETAIYATGTAYEAKFNPVIIQGTLYYTDYPGAGNNPGDLKAVDIRTGEELWSVDAANPIKAGMVVNYITGDQYGAHAYIFTAPATVGFTVRQNAPQVWSMYDAKTGDWILDIANASANKLVEGPMGELLSYTVSGGMLNLWNFTKCIEENGALMLTHTIYSSYEIFRPPEHETLDWNLGIEWSVPIATNISGVPINPALNIQTINSGVVLLSASTGGPISGGTPGGAQSGWRVDAGYSATTGELLWGPINRTLTPWTNVVTAGGIRTGSVGEGVYAEYTNQFLTWTAYNITTGEKMWGPTEPEDNPWGYYDFTAPATIGYDTLYSWGLGGAVYAYDLETGVRKWKFDPGSAGYDTPYGVWALGTWADHYVLADGKLYVRSGHDYTPPVFRGAKLYAIDAYEGTEIWSSLSFDIVGGPAVADGYMVWFNGYDNQIYCYGKGGSKTTVTAPNTAVPLGSSVVISGSVTDESPSTKTSLLTTRFPNGVPAISDEDQSAWMEYLYQQQPMPQDLTGVEVTLDAMAPDGSFINIARVTSDASGFFSYLWEPEQEGKYTVIATFEGSESYYASYSETAVGVGPAPSPAEQVSPEAEPGAGLTTTQIAIIAGVAVLAVAGIGAYWIIRRRK